MVIPSTVRARFRRKNKHRERRGHREKIQETKSKPTRFDPFSGLQSANLYLLFLFFSVLSVSSALSVLIPDQKLSRALRLRDDPPRRAARTARPRLHPGA